MTQLAYRSLARHFGHRPRRPEQRHPRLEKRRSAGSATAAAAGNAVDRLRQSIARDLHDDLGSGLGSIAVLADLLAEGNLGGERTRDLAARIASTAGELSESLGAIVWSLRDADVNLGDIAAEVHTRAADQCEPRGTAVHVRLSPDAAARKVSSSVARAARLIAREAIHNASKHAAATELRIDIGIVEHGFYLAVADNGRGFSASPGDSLGVGLDSMTFRAKEAGGELRLESSRGAGTCVCARLPLLP